MKLKIQRRSLLSHAFLGLVLLSSQIGFADLAKPTQKYVDIGGESFSQLGTVKSMYDEVQNLLNQGASVQFFINDRKPIFSSDGVLNRWAGLTVRVWENRDLGEISLKRKLKKDIPITSSFEYIDIDRPEIDRPAHVTIEQYLMVNAIFKSISDGRGFHTFELYRHENTQYLRIWYGWHVEESPYVRNTDTPVEKGNVAVAESLQKKISLAVTVGQGLKRQRGTPVAIRRPDGSLVQVLQNGAYEIPGDFFDPQTQPEFYRQYSKTATYSGYSETGSIVPDTGLGVVFYSTADKLGAMQRAEIAAVTACRKETSNLFCIVEADLTTFNLGKSSATVSGYR